MNTEGNGADWYEEDNCGTLIKTFWSLGNQEELTHRTPTLHFLKLLSEQKQELLQKF